MLNSTCFHQLACFDIDVADLAEIKLAKEGNIREIRFNYTIFWKGKEAGKKHIHRVDFVIQTKLMEQPHPYCHQQMLHDTLKHGTFLTLISIHALTLVSDDVFKDSFYDLFGLSNLKDSSIIKLWVKISI